jgi:segregation and condensation protein B
MEETQTNPAGETPQPQETATDPEPQKPSVEPAPTYETDPADLAPIDTPAAVEALAAPEGDAPQTPSAEPAAAPETDLSGVADLGAQESAAPPTPPAEPVNDAGDVAVADMQVAADASVAPEGDAPVAVEDLLVPEGEAPAAARMEDAQLMAVLEAVVYVAEEPLTLAQIAAALQQPLERVDAVLRQLIAELERPEHGIAIREVAGGFKMATKAEHHEAVRSFVKSLKPPMKLSLPALETLAVIAYKQPVTAPEIMEIRGVQGAGVLKTLLDRKLIAVAGRKNVIGKPILYKTTRDFLIQFGLNDVSELPSLKEFEDIRRMAFADSEPEASAPAASPDAPSPEPAPQPQPEPQPDSPAAPEPGTPEQES